MSLLSWLGNAVTSGVLDAFFLKLYERYDKNAGAKAGVKKVTDFLTKEEKRGKVWSFVVVTLPTKGPEAKTASERLVHRQRMRQHTERRTYEPHAPYQHGDEDKLLETLEVIYDSCVDDGKKVNEEQLATILTVLGRMSDDEFDTVIEGFDNDRARQYALRVWNESLKLYQRFNEAGGRWQQKLIDDGM
ncbi:MAG: hypothetical protein M1153_00300 [Patescibacteria group bacterium]|nr:hypothetical protein [Patescibacteria group bacterium]